MLARLQRFTTITLLATALLWFVGFAKTGHPWWGLLGGLIIVLGYAVALGVEFILLVSTFGDDPTPRPSAGQVLRAWCIETLTAPRIFCWRQPFRTDAEPDVLPTTASGRRGVLLVHGLVCNRAFWNPWLSRLRSVDIPTVAISMEPVFGSIDVYPPFIEAGIRRLEAVTGLAPVVVAHSMGGLAVRAWLRDHADGGTRVHRIVTIASPHRGTWLARIGRGTGSTQMGLNSAWLLSLAATETVDQAGRFTCFYSHCDNVVFPPISATLHGADNRHIPGCSHVHLAFVDEVFDTVCRWVRGDSPRPV